jgi:hypothetical protein
MTPVLLYSVSISSTYCLKTCSSSSSSSSNSVQRSVSNCGCVASVQSLFTKHSTAVQCCLRDTIAAVKARVVDHISSYSTCVTVIQYCAQWCMTAVTNCMLQISIDQYVPFYIPIYAHLRKYARLSSL